jgi:hypothetical protein
MASTHAVAGSARTRLGWRCRSGLCPDGTGRLTEGDPAACIARVWPHMAPANHRAWKRNDTHRSFNT